jgi:hypothetical protein
MTVVFIFNFFNCAPWIWDWQVSPFRHPQQAARFASTIGSSIVQNKPQPHCDNAPGQVCFNNLLDYSVRWPG